MPIRKANAADLSAVSAIYEAVIAAEERGEATVGWKRGVYPTRRTAEAALARGDLFALEEDGRILGCGIVNQIQVDVYAGAPWRFEAPDKAVMVLHTLAIDPSAARRGYGRRFVAFYEAYARAAGCAVLRIDTNARNLAARSLYQALGYREAAVVPAAFNGIAGVDLVLLEKSLEEPPAG